MATMSQNSDKQFLISPTDVNVIPLHEFLSFIQDYSDVNKMVQLNLGTNAFNYKGEMDEFDKTNLRCQITPASLSTLHHLGL